MEIDFKVTPEKFKNVVNKATKANLTSEQAGQLLGIYEQTIIAGFNEYLNRLATRLFTK